VVASVFYSLPFMVQQEARAWGVLVGTVCGRWQGGRRVSDLRLSGRWLEEAGFGVGGEYEVEVAAGEIKVQAI